ncbi:MAG: hypothetical protein HEEMFOPI_00205 [Holosporales bacterium]
MEDIRWIQRLNHFEKALSQLLDAVELSYERSLSSIETQGLIKAFEFTHELSWNVMKDFFDYQGNSSIMGSRDATREAFKYGLILDGEGWMEMIKSRNQTSHTYNEETALDISEKIIHQYTKLFKDFQQKIKEQIHEK